MARKPRIHFPGAFYHVIARGNRGQKLFIDDQDYQRYLKFLDEYKERYRFLLYAYILMPNHIHLLIEVAEAPLSRIMQPLQFRYTRNFNIKYKKWGHLFQGRYKAILCQKDSYFLELSAYIHLSAVRAGLAQDPLEYPWSSYRFYVKGREEGFVDRDFLLAQFSGNKAIARRAYAHFAYSGPFRPPIPGESGHPFRMIPATDSGAIRPPLI
jgi:putative transposase